MNNEELKKKIVKILSKVVLFEDAYSWSGLNRRTAELLADALIAAGIGFMDDDITSQIVATIKRDTEPITMENVALRKQVEEAERRTEVAEKALKNRAACHILKQFPNETDELENLTQEVYEAWIEQAEKELAKEPNE